MTTLMSPHARFRRNTSSNMHDSASKSEGQAITLPQLLAMVEQACRGDKPLSHQLFTAFMQMRLNPNTPANERALADVLIRILIGERAPSLDALDAEDRQPVQELLKNLPPKAP